MTGIYFITVRDFNNLNPIIMREKKITVTDRKRAWNAALIMAESPRTHFPIAQIAEMVGMPEKRLKAVFKKMYGMGLYAYLRQLRMDKARQLLLEGKSIKMIIHVIGYENESNFCKAFRRKYKQSPREWSDEQTKRIG